MLRKVKDEYFEDNIRDNCEEKYHNIGLLLGLSILQNGPFPHFLKEEELDEIFSTQPSKSCFKAIQKAFQEIGIFQMVKAIPLLRHLFRRNENQRLTLKKVIALIKPHFAETGSNERTLQNLVYAKLVKYFREAASGRRKCINLGSILQFATGIDEEPVLGYDLKPSLTFVEAVCVNYGFLPRASTCVNRIHLPRPTQEIKLPDDEKLFEIYDSAFASSFFGQK